MLIERQDLSDAVRVELPQHYAQRLPVARERLVRNQTVRNRLGAKLNRSLAKREGVSLGD